jgi:protein-arginine kinase activator protein McsA
MTDKEIEKLAELIVSKMYDKQEELDAKFIEEVKAAGKDAQIYIMNDDDSILNEDEQKLRMLERELDIALKQELYGHAADVQQQINKLKSKMNGDQ